MEVLNEMWPSSDEQRAELAEAGPDGPIVMINLLRYREQAAYPDGFDAEPCSGREAYQRYGQGVMPLIGAAGARPIWSGTATHSLIAAEDEVWDDAILVEYPPEAGGLNTRCFKPMQDEMVLALVEGSDAR